MFIKVNKNDKRILEYALNYLIANFDDAEEDLETCEGDPASRARLLLSNLREIDNQDTETCQKYRDDAFKQYNKDGELEIETDTAIVSLSENGAYVEAWAWVDSDEIPSGN